MGDRLDGHHESKPTGCPVHHGAHPAGATEAPAEHVAEAIRDASEAKETFFDADMLNLATHLDGAEAMYEWLREFQPLFWDTHNEIWAVSRYDDVLYVSKHPELFCSGNGVVPNVGQDDWPDEAMINLDGDEHTRQRALINRGFTPRRIGQWEARVREIATELIDKMIARGSGDLVEDLARPMPFQLISSMLGYPAGTEDVLDWTDTYSAGGCGPNYITEEVVEAFSNFFQFHEILLEEKKANPGEDLLSIWLDAELDGHKLSEDKLLYEHSLLLVGGAETTRNAISLGMTQLMRNPDQMSWLVEHLGDEGVLDNAVEEMIRYSCPFVRMSRTATQDVELYGQTIKEGQQIIMLYPAANRDPRAFDQPQRFDVRRDFKRPSLSFGHGKHYCLGANLARLETKVAVEALLTRLPDMRLDPKAEPKRLESSFVRSLTSCPVVFEPRR